GLLIPRKRCKSVQKSWPKARRTSAAQSRRLTSCCFSRANFHSKCRTRGMAAGGSHPSSALPPPDRHAYTEPTRCQHRHQPAQSIQPGASIEGGSAILLYCFHHMLHTSCPFLLLNRN